VGPGAATERFLLDRDGDIGRDAETERILVTLPNFIVIGAAKAGTTSLYWYLAEHPAVFMSPVKETNYFAYGLDADGRLLYGDPEYHAFPVKTLEEYQQLFAGAAHARAVGEASPIYLECPQAAQRIRTLLPAVQIICSIRHPVDRAYSDYVMYLRHRGRRLDPVRDLTTTAAWAQPDSRWMQIGRYDEQLSRYFEAFPRAQIRVFLFDDLKRSAGQVIQEVYQLLDVDPLFVPDLGTPHAPGGLPAIQAMERLLTNRAVQSAIKPWLPVRAVNWVRRLRRRNLQPAPPLPAQLRQELTRPFHDNIARTSQLIGRSLDHWL
jgi:Sulfotransferase family